MHVHDNNLIMLNVCQHVCVNNSVRHVAVGDAYIGCVRDTFYLTFHRRCMCVYALCTCSSLTFGRGKGRSNCALPG